MTATYVVPTAGQADAVTQRLQAHGFDVTPQRGAHEVKLTISPAPCLKVDEFLITYAPVLTELNTVRSSVRQSRTSLYLRDRTAIRSARSASVTVRC